jgi:hypothetical protein
LKFEHLKKNSTRFLITVATLLTGLVLTGSATVIWMIQKFVRGKKLALVFEEVEENISKKPLKLQTFFII